ncbi:hypothetical protein MD484_g6054, partial [Candolleomyces efflorescens]
MLIHRIRASIGSVMLAWEVLAFAFAAYHAWNTAWNDLKFLENPKKSLNYVVFSQVALSLNWKVNVLYARLMSALKLPLTGFLTARFILKLRMWEENSKNHNSRTTLPCYLSTNAPNTSTGFDFHHETINHEVEPATSNHSGIEVTTNISAIDELGGDIGPRPTYSPHYPEEPLESPSSAVLKSAGGSSAVDKGKRREVRPEDDLCTAEYAEAVDVPQLGYQSRLGILQHASQCNVEEQSQKP